MKQANPHEHVTRTKRPARLETLARFVSVALTIAVIGTGATAYAQQAVSGAAQGVEVCSGDCTVIFVSNPSARFRLAQWSGPVTPKLPLDVNCTQSCGEPGQVKKLYAEQEAATYTVVWVDANNNATLMSIPGKNDQTCEPAFIASFMSGVSVRRSCSELPTAPAVPSGVIAGRVTLPDGTPATRVRVSALAESPVTGKWVVTGVPNAPWELQLTVNGGRVTGTIWQRNTREPIAEGFVDGTDISFSVIKTDRTNTRRITFTGKLSGNELRLSHTVQVIAGRRDTGRGLYGSNSVTAVTAHRATTAPDAFTETDRDGRYRLDRLPPGRYRITVGASEDPTISPGVASTTDAVLVTVGPHGTLEGRDFTLTVTPGISAP
jgi:hypothetical protein